MIFQIKTKFSDNSRSFLEKRKNEVFEFGKIFKKIKTSKIFLTFNFYYLLKNY